ncbi:MAG TPA: protease modulator HflC [Candidatus Blautia faecipullorum]|nr:protease modulator HflC [Candidatus Blautia faecipullorum]
MNKKRAIIILAGAAVLLAAGMSVTVTRQNEYKLIRQFGKVQRVIDKPGISLKIPFVESTATLPKQTLLYDLAPSDVITRDKKTMITDSYVIWKISDPLKFAQTLNSSIENGESRINTAIYNATKNAISSMSQDEVITSRDGELSELVMKAVDQNMAQYGVSIMLFETKQLDLPDDNKEAVYERMISERDNIAATYTAEGSSEAKVIRNTTDKEVAIQISDARKQAEILEAEGEQEYMKILAEAYGEEGRTEFYSFVRSLDALKNSMKGENKTVILSADSPIAQIFQGAETEQSVLGE